MKVTAAMAVLAFVAVQAAAVPEAAPVAEANAEAQPDALRYKNWVNFCGVRGQQCGKARTAEADPEAYRIKNWINFCGVVGQQCGKKRAATAMANAVAHAEANPEALRYKNWVNFCGVPGQQCGRKRSAEADAEPNALRYKNWINFCGVRGQQCGKARSAPEEDVGNELGHCTSPGEPCAIIKRSANAIAEALAEAEAAPKPLRYKNWVNFCGVPGQQCGKARDLTDVVIDHTNDAYGSIYEREADALPEAEADADADPEARRRRRKKVLRYKNWVNFCGVRGQQCGRRRDDIDATEKVRRDADAEANADPLRYKNWVNFCGVRGQQCGKARDAAEAINKADPTLFRDECFAEGGECDTLLKIQKAFHQAKAEGAAEKALSPQGKLAACGGKNECTGLAHAHQYAAEHNPRSASEAEKRCNGPEGLCTLATRDLAGLEETIDAAVEAMLNSTTTE